MMRVVGLLRGINVGTSVKVPMKDLKALVEAAGGAEVQTYLNSGNVVFTADGPLVALRERLEHDLAGRFGQPIPLLLLEAPTVKAVRDAIPADWQNDETQQTYVAYLFPEADRPDLIAELPVKHELIEFRYVPSALIWNIRRELYNRSQITKLASHPAYRLMTTRNVNTARKLADLC